MTFHHQIFTMGTRLNIVLPNVDEELGTHIIRTIELLIVRNNYLINNYQPNSAASAVNKALQGEKTHIDIAFYNILKECAHFYDLTHGYFDITCGSLLSAWGITHGIQSGSIPNAHQLQAITKTNRWNDIEFTNDGAIIKHRPDISLDFGGYGKGLLLDDIQKTLMQLCIENGFISFGESSILTIGTFPNSDYWALDIMHPFSSNAISVCELRLCNMSASISGSIDKNPDKQFGHIVNPKTGMAVEPTKMVIIEATSPLLAEILSTALMVADPEMVLPIIENLNIEQAVILNLDKESIANKRTFATAKK